MNLRGSDHLIKHWATVRREAGAAQFFAGCGKLRGMKTLTTEAAPGKGCAERLDELAAQLAATLATSVERFVCASEENLGHLETKVAE